MTADVAGCLGKSRFLTYGQAARRCKTLNRRKNRDTHLAPYRCASCRRWHLGGVDSEYRKHRQRPRWED